jgi:hypothetical protein
VVDRAGLEAAPYAGALGYLAGAGLLSTEDLQPASAALRQILTRKPSTAERTGFAQDSVRFLGFVLLAKAAADQRALQSLSLAFPVTASTDLPSAWFRYLAGIELGLSPAPFNLRNPECSVLELATASVARSIDFSVSKAAFPLLDMPSVDNLLARRACLGEINPSEDLGSMIALLGLEAAINARFSGEIDPLELARSLCSNFVSALERWPDGRNGGRQWLIDGEADIQRIVYLQFRSVFSGTVFEDPQPKDGVRSTRPDFGVRELRLALEVKYIKRAEGFSSIQQEVESDATAFFPGGGRYDRLFVFVYDASRSLDKHASLEGRLKQLPNVAGAFVVSPPARLSSAGVGKTLSRPKIPKRGRP